MSKEKKQIIVHVRFLYQSFKIKEDPFDYFFEEFLFVKSKIIEQNIVKHENFYKFAKNKWEQMPPSQKQQFIIMQKIAMEDLKESEILDGDALINNLSILERRMRQSYRQQIQKNKNEEQYFKIVFCQSHSSYLNNKQFAQTILTQKYPDIDIVIENDYGIDHNYVTILEQIGKFDIHYYCNGVDKLIWSKNAGDGRLQKSSKTQFINKLYDIMVK